MLPTAVAISAGVALQVIDYQVADTRAVLGPDGTGTLELDAVPGGQLWRVERIVISSTSTKQLGLGVYGGAATPASLRDWTNLPAGLVAVGEYPQPLTVASNTSLVIAVTGGAPGDTVTAVVQYAVVQRTAGGS